MQGWLLVASLVPIATAANAQTPVAPEPPKFARVSGVVVDTRDGRPLRRAMICFRRGGDTGYSDSSTEHCDETDAQGRFNLSSLPPARYTYGVEREGYFVADPIADGLPSVIGLISLTALSPYPLFMPLYYRWEWFLSLPMWVVML